MIITRGFVDNTIVTRGFGPGAGTFGPGFYTLPIPERLKERYDFETYLIQIGRRLFDSEKSVILLSKRQEDETNVKIPVGSFNFEEILNLANIYLKRREIFITNPAAAFSQKDGDFSITSTKQPEIHRKSKKFEVIEDG